MIDVVRVPAWSRYPWLRHGFSTREGGVSRAYGDADGALNLGFTREDSAGSVAENRTRFLAEVGAAGSLATVRQVHGAAVRVVRAPSVPDEPAVEADAQVTALPGTVLGILTADCVPVLLADVRQRVVAAVHAGWRGTAAGVAGAAVDAMQREFGSAAGDIVAAIGPSVGPCCYCVGEELLSSFADGGLFERRTQDGVADQLLLNLWEANRRDLQRAGVPAAGISVVGECTVCSRARGHSKYFSYRAESGRTGRMMTVVAIGE